jgi:hypothetical protein
MRKVRIAAATVLVGCGVLAVAITSVGASSPASAAALIPPTATTGPPSNVGESSATVTGTVSPNGQATSYYFRYGTTTSYGLHTSPTGAGSGTRPVGVRATLAGLAADITYHYQLVVQSARGTTAGTDRALTTTLAPPTATTGPPSSIGQSGGTITGTVNPNGLATSYYFRYGPTISYGLQTSPTGAGSGARPVGVSATLAGLAANTAYHYQLVAENARGISSGTDQTLITTSSPSQAVVLGHEGFVSPGWVVGAEVGCFHGTSPCTGHLTMWHNGTVIAQRDYSIAPDSGGFQNMELNPAGIAELGQNGPWHLLAVTVTATASNGQSVSWVIHLARWVWH